MAENQAQTMKFFDFSCPYASLEYTTEMTGACRRELILWCLHYQKLVKKNDLCITQKWELCQQDCEYQRLFGSAKKEEKSEKTA